MKKRTIKQIIKDLFFNKVISEKIESYNIKTIPQTLISELKQPLN